jgi:hypothetical protein
LFASLIVACSTSVQPSAVDWSERLPVIGPFGEQPTVTKGSLLGLLRFKTNESRGYLRVYTDTDVLVNGGLGSNNVRRSFDLYSPDGTLIQADIYNQGGRYGEEPLWLQLTPGRYVVASIYGTTYRKVQVDVSAGEITVVPASVLREASPVFAQ